MIKKILKPFLGKGLGGTFPINYFCKLFIFLFNPFEINGNKLYLPLDEIQFFTGYEKEKVKLFKEMVKENNTIVDLGAHIGFYTILAAKLVGRGGMVFAFEPCKKNLALLLKNKEKNGYNNIILEKKGVGDKTEKGKLYLWGDSRYQRLYGSNNCPFEEIEIIRLDDYFKNYTGKIDLIKINIAGSEGAAILGMKELLKRFRDIKIIMQYSPGRIKEFGGNPIDCLNVLRELDFRIWEIKEKLETVVKIEKLAEDYTTKELFCRR